MAVQKGSAVIFGLGDGASPEVFTTIGGDQNCDFQFTDGEAVYTNKSSSGLWQHRMDGGTVRDLRTTLSLVDVDDASMQTIVAALFAASTRHISGRLTLPGFGTVTATWQVTEFSNSGELDNPSRINLTLVSAGAPTFAAS